jgi:hypothetical protein
MNAKKTFCIRALSPLENGRAACSPRPGGSAEVRREGGALGDRGDEPGRRRKRFYGTGRIFGLQELDAGVETCWSGELERQRQNEYRGSDRRGFRIVTAGHAAGHHARRVMAAIHVMGTGGGSLVVMMLLDGALTRSAAGQTVRGPSGSCERGIDKEHSQQTCAC